MFFLREAPLSPLLFSYSGLFYIQFLLRFIRASLYKQQNFCEQEIFFFSGLYSVV